jgi:hypothetical protein
MRRQGALGLFEHCRLLARKKEKKSYNSYTRRVTTRSYERSCPDQIEVEPRLAEKCEAELSIYHPGDQPCDCKIGNRMDPGGEHSGERTGGQRHVTVGCHSALCFDRGAAQQHRHDH